MEWDQQFLEMLRCPVTQQPLEPIDEARLVSVNQAIQNGSLRNSLDENLEQPLEGGLVNQDGTLLYPLQNGIPNLIADDRISLDQLNQSNKDATHE